MTIKSAAKNMFKSVRTRITSADYHRMHKRKAFDILANISKYDGKLLTSQLRHASDEYARTILGGIEYAPWLYVYAAMTGTFKEGWLPVNYFGTKISPSLGLSQVTQYKTLSNVILKTDMLPDLAYFIDGVLFDRHFSPIDLEKLKALISKSNEEVFLKSDKTDKGKGVRKIKLADLSCGRLVEMGDGVIQSPIVQHETFNAIYPASVANIRITTIKNREGGIEFRAAHVNIGRGGDEWTRANNFIQVAVVDRAGNLDDLGFDQGLRQWERHPDTGAMFSGVQVPLFSQAVEQCIKLHTQVPHFLVIGWDIAIDNEDRIRLMEWNAGHIGIKLDEIRTGPCFTGLGWEKLRIKS